MLERLVLRIWRQRDAAVRNNPDRVDGKHGQ